MQTYTHVHKRSVRHVCIFALDKGRNISRSITNSRRRDRRDPILCRFREAMSHVDFGFPAIFCNVSQLRCPRDVWNPIAGHVLLLLGVHNPRATTVAIARRRIRRRHYKQQ